MAPNENMARASFCRLLLAAGILHLTISVLIYLAGRLRLIPGVFDSNGISGGFAFDSFLYRDQAIKLVETLYDGWVADWFYAPVALHVKLYSLPLAIFRPIVGFTMLGVEPLNLLYYLLIILLVFNLGWEVFNRRCGLLAASIVALWPSLLLHTTQLLRDPLFIVCMLTLVLVSIRWLTRSYSLARGLLNGFVAGVASALIWVTRYRMWTMILGFTLLGLFFMSIRLLRERRWLAGNLAGAALLLAMMVSIPTVVGKFLRPDFFLAEPGAATSDASAQSRNSSTGSPPPSTGSPQTILSRLVKKADAMAVGLDNTRRDFFLSYPDAGSNIDAQVRIRSAADLLGYLPKAVANGFLAPYPDMWLTAGSAVGLAGRLLSGLEMLAAYVVELLAVLGLWRGRRRLPVWLLAAVCVIGITALGFLVPNVAILFRLRYVFMVLLIIPGAEGAIGVALSWKSWKSQQGAIKVDE
jgi:hypothetical protein